MFYGETMFREKLLSGGFLGAKNPVANPPEIPRLYPTTIRLPVWARPMTIRTAISRLDVSDFKARHISPEFEVKRGLLKSMVFPKLPAALNPKDYMESIAADHPIDGVEYVEWMHICAIENAILHARMNEYNRLGSQMVAQSGDPAIPGTGVEDVYYPSQLGLDVMNRGFAIASTPRGNFNVPNLSKQPGVFRDLISCGLMSWLGAGQWTGTIIKWKSLAETPITQAVGFYMDYRGNVAPNFFVQIPARPALSVTVRQRFSSDGDQTLGVNFRDPTDYSRAVGTKSVAIAKGTSEVTYTVSAFPYVAPLICEIQPQDSISTKLEEFVVA